MDKPIDIFANLKNHAALEKTLSSVGKVTLKQCLEDKEFMKRYEEKEKSELAKKSRQNILKKSPRKAKLQTSSSDSDDAPLILLQKKGSSANRGRGQHNTVTGFNGRKRRQQGNSLNDTLEETIETVNEIEDVNNQVSSAKLTSTDMSDVSFSESPNNLLNQENSRSAKKKPRKTVARRGRGRSPTKCLKESMNFNDDGQNNTNSHNTIDESHDVSNESVPIPHSSWVDPVADSSYTSPNAQD